MALNMHSWMDDWFVSLPDNPDQLDKVIGRYEHTRTVGLICLIGVLVILLAVVFLSGKDARDAEYVFIYAISVFLLALNIHADIYTKVLKLQRRHLNRDTKIAEPH